MTTPMLDAVIVLGLVFGGLGGLLALFKAVNNAWRNRVYERRFRLFRERIMADAKARRSMPDGNRDDGPPTLVLSPLDSVVFVEAVLKAQRERDEVKLAFIESVLEEKFEGKGGASGGAGASGEWESPAREPREPVVEAGTIDTARAAVVDEWRSLAEAREMTEIDFPPASVVEYTPTPEMSDPVREEATPAPETTTNEP